MSNESKPKRTAAEIEAELASLRLAMTHDIDELTERLNPVTKVNEVKDRAMNFAGGIRTEAEGVVNDASKGQPEAIGIVVGVATAVVLGVALLATRNRGK